MLPSYVVTVDTTIAISFFKLKLIDTSEFYGSKHPCGGQNTLSVNNIPKKRVVLYYRIRYIYLKPVGLIQ